MFDESFLLLMETPRSPPVDVELGAVVVERFENLFMRGNIV